MNYPGISQCAVVAVTRSHSDKYLCAFIVAKNQEKFDVAQIKLFLSQHLPSYSVPEMILFLEKLPLNLNGKMDQKVLINLAAISQQSQLVNAAQINIEEKLAAIWAEVLDMSLPLDKKQDFFALGGHSLLLLELQQKIKVVFDCELPWEILLPVTTIEQQVEYLKRQGNVKNSNSVIVLQAKGENPPLFLLPQRQIIQILKKMMMI
ncbi:MAG: hypothetical protein JSR33_05410 [Proteobacteria bacterium]|nr:hypothetical protein [Pseudomonadota bacterium]